MFKPWHLLGERPALTISNRLRGEQVTSYETAYGDWGLFPLRVDEVAERVGEAGFEIVDVWTRLSSLNTARWPGWLKDLATWHVCYLARKPARSAEISQTILGDASRVGP